MRRLLFVSKACYLTDTAIPSPNRAMVEALARLGFACEVVCGPVLDAAREVEPMAWLAGQGVGFEYVDGAVTIGMKGVRTDLPPYFRLTVQDVPVTIYGRPSTGPTERDDLDEDVFLRLISFVLDRTKPDVLVFLDGGALARHVLALGQAQGIATVLRLDDPTSRRLQPPDDFAADAVVVSSQFAADYCREAFGLLCTVLPPLFDLVGAKAERRGPEYLTFVDPTHANGVHAFARIAHELGRLRPDIPILVVEGQGTEADVFACGLDLKQSGNVYVMPATGTPGDYWAVTRVCLVPAVGLETPSRVVVETLVNGIPVIASDRGGLPESVGQAGIVLSLPERLTPATRTPPTPEEVAPWVEAVIRLWDDEAFAHDRRERARAEARRRPREDLEARYREFFEHIRPGGQKPAVKIPAGRAKAAVLIPHLNGVDWECEEGLRRVEEGGVKVIRRGGSSAIDVARNDLISNALHDGFDSMMFIDADVGFDPLDVFRLLARPEPVVCGIYAKKGPRGFASHFAEDVSEVLFGPDAQGLYPLLFAATGFLRIKAAVLRRMIAELQLPLCNTKWGRGVWPFFMPMIVPQEEGRQHYLGEDWAFSHRLRQVGVTAMADTTIRLWHWGRFAYGWEEAGADHPRYRSYTFRLGNP